MLHPFYKKINSFIKLPSVSSIISVILVIVIIFLPLVLISILLVQQSVVLYNSFSGTNIASNVQGLAVWLQGTPLAPYIETAREQWTGYAANAAKAISLFLFENLKNITQNSVRFIFMVFIMFYTLYYFFKDGENMLNKIMHLSPLGDKYEKMLYDRFRSTSAATLKGTFIIGGIQGLIGFVLFWFTGIEGAFVWGVIMVALSIIPAIGSFIIWMPAGIIMLALGNIWQGVTILLVGTLLISMIDNVLRPPLVGKDTEMHPLVILFTTLGGIVLFGISGFIIGPIIAALFLSIMSIYNHYYKSELAKN
jgi:predicted PurR-regulated permease PerM